MIVFIALNVTTLANNSIHHKVCTVNMLTSLPASISNNSLVLPWNHIDEYVVGQGYCN